MEEATFDFKERVIFFLHGEGGRGRIRSTSMWEGVKSMAWLCG